MALTAARIALRGFSRAGHNITATAFVEPLAILTSDAVLAVLADRGAWASGLVVFSDLALSSFGEEPEPHEVLARELHDAMCAAAEWLNARPVATFAQMKGAGMTLDLLLDLWIDQDQFELSLPPAFLAACARCGLPVEIVTND